LLNKSSRIMFVAQSLDKMICDLRGKFHSIPFHSIPFHSVYFLSFGLKLKKMSLAQETLKNPSLWCARQAKGI
jgi:hypothetical protein